MPGYTQLATNFYEYKVCHSQGIKRPKGSDLPHFEFVHTDGNYKKFLFTKTAGISIQDVQTIIALTSMEPGCTVYLQRDFIVYGMFLLCVLSRTWADKAGKVWIHSISLNTMISSSTLPVVGLQLMLAGGVIIFQDTLPHGPDLNTSDMT